MLCTKLSVFCAWGGLIISMMCIRKSSLSSMNLLLRKEFEIEKYEKKYK
jgi:hypothetical protein